jgi:hypothetical protein
LLALLLLFHVRFINARMRTLDALIAERAQQKSRGAEVAAAAGSTIAAASAAAAPSSSTSPKKLKREQNESSAELAQWASEDSAGANGAAASTASLSPSSPSVHVGLAALALDRKSPLKGGRRKRSPAGKRSRQ